MNDRGSLVLFHVRGVPIRAHWTLLLVLPYLAALLSVEFQSVTRFAGVESSRLVLPPLFWGALLAVGLFASVALHEVAHTLVALRRGGQVRSITLMLLGGSSNVTRMPGRARDEAWMAFAGPLTSLLLGGLLLGLEAALGSAPPDVQMGLYYLRSMNLLLGAFNLLPAFPMDGGRLLRAALVSSVGARRATELAAGVGRVLAVLMGVGGLWSGNFMLMLIALFVYSGAGLEARGARVREALEGLRLVDLLPEVRRPPATLPVDAALSDVLPSMHHAGRLEIVATERDGTPLTVITAADLAGLTSGMRSRLRIRDLLPRIGERHVVVPWDMSANDALARAAEASAPYLIVADPDLSSGHGLVGLLTPADLQTLATLRLMEPREPPRASRGAVSEAPLDRRADPGPARHKPA